MKKLKDYGIRGNCYNLLESYLSNRNQFTQFLDTKSDIRSVNFGVPQGSVLGPLLFLIYINDIVNSTSNGKFILFADDTTVFIVANTKVDVYQKANLVLEKISKYLKSNQLHINMNKCNYIYFKPRVQNNTEHSTCARAVPYNVQREKEIFNLCIDGTKIMRVSSTRFLGIIIDENLSWEEHIDQVHKKLLSSLVVIKRIYKYIPKEQLKTIYQTLFLPHLTYCISTWGGVSHNKLNKLFVVQKRCIRLLFGEEISFDHHEYYQTCARVRPFADHKKEKNFVLEHTKPIFCKFDLLTLKNLYNLHTFVELFKILKYHIPNPLFDLFTASKHCSSNLLHIPLVKLDIAKHNFVFSASSLWNNLIDNIFTKLEPITISTSSTSCRLPFNEIIIPGSSMNSDLSASIGYVKSKVRSLLQQLQCKGDLNIWDNRNSDSKYVKGPCWTWGIINGILEF